MNEAVAPWPFMSMVRAILDIDWGWDENVRLVPFLWTGRTTHPQYVFWPMHMPPGYFYEEDSV